MTEKDLQRSTGGDSLLLEGGDLRGKLRQHVQTRAISPGLVRDQ